MLTKEEAARDLVEWHYEVDPGMTQALRMFTPNEDDPREPIKFLEVSPDTPASGSVMTFTFGPTKDFPYSMTIATITPEEMEQVRRGEIVMPDGWSLDHSFAYPAPARSSQGGRRWRRSKGSVRLPSVPYSGHKRLPV
jgi:hypothetical protein